MAISTSALGIEQQRKSIADKLAGQTKNLQKQPWWKTVGSMALPIISTALMGPLGTALSGISGGGLLGSILSGAGGLLKAGKAKTILGQLGKIGAKSLYNVGTSELSKGLLDKIDPRDVTDIGEGLTPLQIALGGGEATRKLREDYTSAEDAGSQARIGAAIMSAFAQQGGLGAFKGLPFKNLPIPEAGAISEGAKQNMLEGLVNIAKGGPSGQEKNLANMLKLPSVEGSTFADVNPETIKFGQNILQSQLKPSLPSQQNMLQGLITDARGRVGGRFDSIESRIASQQGLEDFNIAKSLFPNMDKSDYQSILDAYYNYEDITEGGY